MSNDARELLREASDMLACSYSGFADDASESVRYAKLRDDLLARITALLSENADGWMPIESAPKDECVLLRVPTTLGKWNKYLPLPGYWEHRQPESSGFWVTYNHDEAIGRVDPTHWQPSPAAPGSASTPQPGMVTVPSQDALDAKRYRWLNSQEHFMLYVHHSFDNKDLEGNRTYRLKCGDCLDSWIDARIAAALRSGGRDKS